MCVLIAQPPRRWQCVRHADLSQAASACLLHRILIQKDRRAAESALLGIDMSCNDMDMNANGRESVELGDDCQEAYLLCVWP